MELHPRAFTPRTPPTPPPALALARDPLPLTAAVHAFIASKLGMRGVAESSAAAYQGHLGRFIRAVGASKTLDEASGEVEPFLLILKRRRRAPSYRAKAFSVYRDFYRWACEHGHAGANPLAEQRAPIVPDAEKRFLAVEEVHQLLDSVRAAPLTHAHRDYALYWTMYGTWGRGTEVCRSRAADYDLASCTVRFYGKGGKYRLIPFDPQLKPVLEEWLAVRPRESPMMFPAKAHTSDRYTVLDRDRAARVLRLVYAPAAGLGVGVTPHTLRRSGADHARRRGVDLRVIQSILGHKSLTTTQRYLGLPSPDELKGAWE